MDLASKRRGRPSPDALTMKPLAFNLEEALAVENIDIPNLLVIQEYIQPGEVTINGRDGAVHIMRFQRVWFEVPQSVFFRAITYLDLFISQMKVKSIHLNCLTNACFYYAAEKQGCNIDVGQLVAVSQSGGSVNDLLRMANIVKKKLNLHNNDNDTTITCADFLLIFLEISEYISMRSEVRLHACEILQKEQLLTRLEVLMADSSCAFYRPSTLALVLIKLELEKFLTQGIASRSRYFVGELIQLLSIIRELQVTCKIQSAELINCSSNASNILAHYDNCDRIRLGQNTSEPILPITDKTYRIEFLQSDLATIEEKNEENS